MIEKTTIERTFLPVCDGGYPVETEYSINYIANSGYDRDSNLITRTVVEPNGNVIYILCDEKGKILSKTERKAINTTTKWLFG